MYLIYARTQLQAIIVLIYFENKDLIRQTIPSLKISSQYRLDSARENDMQRVNSFAAINAEVIGETADMFLLFSLFLWISN